MWARRWGGLLLALSWLVVAAPARAAQCAPPEVSADPASASAGQSVKVSGKNFGTCGGVLGGDAGIHLELVQGSRSFDLGTVDAGSGGSFEQAVVVPAEAVPGSALLSATGPSGAASTGFTVTAAAPSTTVPIPERTPTPTPTTVPPPLTATTRPPSTTSTSQTTLTTIETLLPVPSEPETTTSSSSTTVVDQRRQLSIRNAGGDDGPPVWLVIVGAMALAGLLGGAGYLVYRRRWE